MITISCALPPAMLRHALRAWALLGLFSTPTIADSLHPQELQAARHGRSAQPVRELAKIAFEAALTSAVTRRQAEPLRVNPHGNKGATQTSADILLESLKAAATPLAELKIRRGPSIEGLGAGMDSFQMQLSPPDANGAVGDTQFVEWVNNSIAIFDKHTLARIAGPFLGNLLWRNFGGNCEEHNNGDAIVQYDKLAHRWFLAQFSVTGGKQSGYSECIAISMTSDATGNYWLYEFQYPVLDDYPKVGVWPDGYYVSFNMYDVQTDANGKDVTTFLGPRACVYDRTRMLKGLVGRQQCFQLSSQYFGFLPADFDGRSPPTSGTPNFFIAIGEKPSTLELWKFLVNWDQPADTTFGVGADSSPNATIPVAPFIWACNGQGSTCIPQPQKVNGQEELDSLGDRLMFRAAYRHFSDHDSLLINHSVDTGAEISRTAIRWYELRDLNKDVPVVFQQGTFSPDGVHRWIGSIAMDSQQDIVVGYNASGSTVSPGLRMAARLPGDPLGLLRSETTLFEGTGIQTCTPQHGACDASCQLPADEGGGCDRLTRWGDYSSLILDPSDDCTFWYVGEYQARDGAYNWHTGITTFSVGSCAVRPLTPSKTRNPNAQTAPDRSSPGAVQ